MKSVVNAALVALLAVAVLVTIVRAQPEPPLALTSTVVLPKLSPVVPSLADTITEMMALPRCVSSAKDAMSPALKQVTVSRIDRILTKKGGDRNTQESFVLLICLETRFRADLKSSAGAIGISQLILSTARGEAKEMGLGDITAQDLFDPELNLLIGYTHYLGLVKQFNGNTALAAAAYNAGSAGSTVKGLPTGAVGAAESDKYVRDLFYLKEAHRVATKQQ